MNKNVLKQIKNLTPGDLIFVSWFDASIGKSLSGGLAGIDVPKRTRQKKVVNHDKLA